MSKCRWTNASGDFSAANPENWEGGRLPQTIEDWENATPKRAGYFSGYELPWPRPIPVSERLPEIVTDEDFSPAFLAFCSRCPGWHLAFVCVDGAWTLLDDDSIDPHTITHWLPLPPKPE